MVRLRALAGSRPGSPYYLSYHLAAADQPCSRPGSQAQHCGGTPGFSTDSPGVTGCQGVRVAHWGRNPHAPISGYVLGRSEATTNVPHLYNRAHCPDSYDREVGSSLACTLTTYMFSLFSNAPTSLIVAYRYNHAPQLPVPGDGRGPCVSSGVPLKHPSSILEWTYSLQRPPVHAFAAVSAAPPRQRRAWECWFSSFLRPPLAHSPRWQAPDLESGCPAGTTWK